VTAARDRRSFAAIVAAALVALAITPAALGAGAVPSPPSVQPLGALIPTLVAVAWDDEMTTKHDRTKTVGAPGVLANDTDLNLLGGGLRAELVTDAARGDLDLHDDGGYVYTPDPGYVGADSFRYKAVGALLDSNTATVWITVTNVAPVASSDSYTAVTGVTLKVSAPGVLGDDDDADDDSLTANKVTDSGSGSVDLNSDGSFTFTSGGSFMGTRTFTYEASDGITSSNTATVTITVSAAAATPTPAPTPTPRPTPTPTPTPIIPLPTLPLPTLTPLPTLALPTLTPLPTPILTPTPGATATPTASRQPSPGSSTAPTLTPSPGAGGTTTPRPGSDASPTPTPDGAATDAPGTGAGTAGGDDDGAGLAAPGDRFLLPAVDPPGIDAIIDASFTGFGSIEWAVPAFALGVPGLLLMIAVGAQTIVGVAWLPFVRRWLGGFGVRRRDRA
jgi:hypothetical protein